MNRSEAQSAIACHRLMCGGGGGSCRRRRQAALVPCLRATAPHAASRLTRLQEAYAEAEADLLSGKKGGKRRKGGQAVAGGEGGDEEDAFFSGLALQGKLPKFVELLKFKVMLAG